MYMELYESYLFVRQRLQDQLEKIKWLNEDAIVLRNIGMRQEFENDRT